MGSCAHSVGNDLVETALQLVGHLEAIDVATSNESGEAEVVAGYLLLAQLRKQLEGRNCGKRDKLQ